MPRPLVYLLYNLLLPVALLLGLPSFLIKGVRRGGLARNFRQRLGFFSAETLAHFRGKKPIWIHAVSVGEVFIALKLIEALRAAAPDRHLVLSTTTTTGYRVAADRVAANNELDTLTVIHNPVDLPFVAARVARLVEPCALVLVEAEIWPNLVGLMKRRGIPVLLANARLSPRSEGRYTKVRGWIAPIFSLLDGATVPFDEDAARWSALGISSDRIEVTGSVKFDHAGHAASGETLRHELHAWLAETGMPSERRILLGGSTHDGEERLLAETARELRSDFPELELVLVPRHAERGGEIAEQLRELGLDPVLRVPSNRGGSANQRSHAGRAAPAGPARPRVWIANTTGELRAWFHLAELVVIGKSFRGGGGQNPVEPILAGRPVVVGPRMENFAEVVAELIRIEGLHQVADEDELRPALRGFLAEPESGRAMAARGAAAMARHAGSAARNAAWILRHLPPGPPP